MITLRDRIYDKFVIHPKTRCWIWTGARRRSGYGELRIRAIHRNCLLASRLSWEVHNGSIPDGMCVLHTCDNPACISPDHLFLGTLGDNNQDKTRKGRQARGASLVSACRRGREASQNFLKFEDVAFIKGHPELSNASLARRFAVDPSNISHIRAGRTWRHVRVF